MESTWRPLITDPALQERLRGVIREISEAVQAWGGERRVDELTDHAVLRAYLSQDGTVEDPEDVATESLERAIVQYAEGVASPALYGGGARIGWTVAHLAGGEDADEVCGAIEEALIAAIDRWDGDYDLIGGLVGFGVYALERLESERGAVLAARVLDALERRASPQPGGLGWHTDPRLLPDWQREIAPDGYLNLGLAHGIPGVIALLARYVARGVEVARARTLLDGAVGFLLASAPPPESPEQGRFPGWLPDRGRRSERIAWCYGDLGVAVAMWSAAAAADNAEWKREALAIAHGAAARDVERSGTVDAGICHGASGNAHLFNRLHQATGDAVLGAAAVRWFDRTLAMRRTEPIAGFPMGWIEDGIQWRADASMLTGAPGVALALHAAISDVEPAWDRLLLADLA